MVKRLKDGDTSLKDEEGRGRHSDFDDQALLDAVEEDESLTTRILAEMFDVDQSTIVRRFKKFGKVWKLAGWVPHEFSEDNKTVRVAVFGCRTKSTMIWMSLSMMLRQIAFKNRGFFERGIDMLPEKWEAVIEVDGEYAPE
uniref:Transposase n=1 Tax=Acrobeloides nanus TaxID=290746 RepID=A0A914CSZ2_9BILA